MAGPCAAASHYPGPGRRGSPTPAILTTGPGEAERGLSSPTIPYHGCGAGELELNLRLQSIVRSLPTSALLAIPVAFGWATQPPQADATGPDLLRIDSPQPEQHVRLSIPLLEVRGRTGAAELFEADVALAIDLSQTAFFASGVDVDGDGTLGETRPWAKKRKLAGRHPNRWTSDPDDTVFEAEMIAAASLIRGLVPRKNRVGVLTYTEVPRVRAWVGPPEVALASLDRITLRLGSKGSDVGRALDSAARMLRDLPADRDRARTRAILLFTDGGPVPLGDGRPKGHGVSRSVRPSHWAQRAALASARELAEQEIALYIFTFGEQDADAEQFLFDLAEAGRGPLIPVERPEALLADLSPVDLQPRSFRIRNLTNRSEARAVRTSRDGWFDGFVTLAPGANEIEVRATLIDGSAVSERRVVVYEKPSVETEADRRNSARLLVELRQRTAEVESYTGPPSAPAPVSQD